MLTATKQFGIPQIFIIELTIHFVILNCGIKLRKKQERRIIPSCLSAFISCLLSLSKHQGDVPGRGVAFVFIGKHIVSTC
ncbi:hypothetical protein TRIP_C20049 [Candidatus Zixiibacteriota bacterium]|nr:hypothetical protein TRIP_C20049 [candidate division Zixibacteria bacterium]